MKSARQNKILEIIAEQDIETQGQLIEALKDAGFPSTQATVSRDIKELRLLKDLSHAGRYRYVATTRDDNQNSDQRLMAIFRECVKSSACAQNIVVVKTLPGLAPAACSALDGMNLPQVIGTIAGDDTAFLAMSDNKAAAMFCREIELMLKLEYRHDTSGDTSQDTDYDTNV